MVIALTCAQNLFSHIQHALTTKIKTRVALHKGIHQALDDFRWLLQDIQSCPTRIAELVPLLSSAEGHHDTSRKCDGGIWFPSAYIALCEGFSIQPLVWRPQWPKHIINRMVTDTNPGGTISYSVFDLLESWETPIYDKSHYRVFLKNGNRTITSDSRLLCS